MSGSAGVRYAIVIGALLATAGCRETGVASPRATPSPAEGSTPAAAAALRLTFEDGAAEVGAVVPSATNAGSVEVDSAVRTYGGGRIVRTKGREGGFALRFPELSRGSSPSLAVLEVVGRENRAFDPGKGPFRFGADFLLDAQSAGTSIDDGDNLIQRGLFSDPAQFKIQLDHRVPSCRVLGSEGEVFVEAGAEVEPNAWYRVACERKGDQVTLVVGRFDRQGRLSVQRRSARGPIGSVDIEGPESRLSVGGKLGASGALATSSTDQFNGVLDNVFFELIGGAP